MKRAHLLLFVTALLLTSCAAPIKKFVHSSPAIAENLPRIHRVVILSDVVESYEGFGEKSYVAIDASKNASLLMAEAAKEYLEKKGYSVSKVLTPCNGAFMNKQNTFKVSSKREDKPDEQKAPFFVSEDLSSDSVMREAVPNVILGSWNAVASSKKEPNQVFLHTDSYKKSFEVLAAKEEADAFLVVIGNGHTVPSGKSMAQGIGTAVATTLLTGGLLTVIVRQVSAFDTYAALIDAKDGNVLWVNSLKIKGGNHVTKKFYDGKWARTTLYHLPSKK